jgi:hypothetical protein
MSCAEKSHLHGGTPLSESDLQNRRRKNIIKWSGVRGAFLLKDDPVNADPAVFGIAIDTFHTVIADFFRIEIAAVAFTAADALPVIKHARMTVSHVNFLPC